MTDENQTPETAAINALIERAGSLGAHLMEATRPPRFEYIRCIWQAVNDYARAGWQLASLPPYPGGDPPVNLFTMYRQISSVEQLLDEAEQARGEGE